MKYELKRRQYENNKPSHQNMHKLPLVFYYYLRFSDPLTENIEVFPISQSPVYADNVCMKTNSYSTLVTRVVPKIHMVCIFSNIVYQYNFLLINHDCSKSEQFYSGQNVAK